jgi:large subunit ribosomal protein L22
MAYRAILRQVRISPLKVIPVIRLIRGKDASAALDILRGDPHRGAYFIDKALRSAIANAENKDRVDPDDLVVVKATADHGMGKLRRWRAGGRKRGGPFVRRFTHITVEVDVKPEPAPEKKSEKKAEKKAEKK